MKNFLFLVPVMVLLAAACSQTASPQTNNQPAGNPPQAQVQIPSADQPTQQQTDPTADWKTFSDTKNGFEIKYPAQQWSVKTSNDTVNISLDRPNSESPTVQVTVSNQPVAALAGQILADVKSDPVQKLISDKTGSFAGVASREIIYTPAAGGQADFILLSNGGKTFQLLKLDTGEENKDLDIILSTFKFTNIASQSQTTVKVYFAPKSSQQDQCNDVVAVERVADQTPKIATAAINELLKGPTAEEQAKGYKTQIPTGSKLNSLNIVDGVAYADFNAVTESGGGSCSMGIRTAQIRQTLMQFPTVKSVTLSIDGNSNKSLIFQP